MEAYKDLVEESIEQMKEDAKKLSTEEDEKTKVDEAVATQEAARETVEETDDQDSVKEDESEESKEEIASAESEKIQALNDRILRQLAEFDNYRKRTTKEKSEMYDMGVMGIVEKLLPVIDNLERALEAAPKEDSFVEGVDMIYKQFMKILEESKVTVIETKEATFNPDLHNAVMHVEDENYGENMIVEEFQKGYLYKEKVIRHSMVKVAN